MPFSPTAHVCAGLGYFGGLLLEEDFLYALRRGGLRFLWRQTKFLTFEFAIYILVAAWYYGYIVPQVAIELRVFCRRHAECAKYLTPNRVWLPLDTGILLVDAADIHVLAFRDGLKILIPVAILLSILVRVVVAMAKKRSVARAAFAAIGVRALIGVVFVIYIHGAGSFFVIMVVFMFWLTSTTFSGTRLAMPAIWSLALITICAKENNLPIKQYLKFNVLFGNALAFLDTDRKYEGEYHWSRSLPLMVLRLLSYSIDHHNAADRSGYSFLRCLCHTFYAPLWLAGPTIRYDDFVGQCLKGAGVDGAVLAREKDKQPLHKTNLVIYAVQLLVLFFFLEGALQMFPALAIAKSGLFSQLGPRLGGSAMLITLNVMWLKFALFWRVGRAWALAEGIDPPENMLRSLNNHYSVKSFWQCWHASYNKWLIRYIYVPAGGRKNPLLATTLTFGFVAVWHDLEVHLIAWGGMNALFIYLESVIKGSLLRTKRVQTLQTSHPSIFRLMSGCCGVVGILALMAVNMIGYSVGVGGISTSIASAITKDNLTEAFYMFLGTFMLLFSCVQIMFEIRRVEELTRAEIGNEIKAHMK